MPTSRLYGIICVSYGNLRVMYNTYGECLRCIAEQKARPRRENKHGRHQSHVGGARKKDAPRYRMPIGSSSGASPARGCKAGVDTIGMDCIDNDLGCTVQNCQSLCTACHFVTGRQNNVKLLAPIAYIARSNLDVAPQRCCIVSWR